MAEIDFNCRAKSFIDALAGIGVTVIVYSFVRPLATPLQPGFSVQPFNRLGDPCYLLLRDVPDEDSRGKIEALAKACGLFLVYPA